MEPTREHQFAASLVVRLNRAVSLAFSTQQVADAEMELEELCRNRSRIPVVCFIHPSLFFRL